MPIWNVPAAFHIYIQEAERKTKKLQKAELQIYAFNLRFILSAPLFC